ncbi:MAG: hydroxyacid dehydrogenase [Armatimonadetes bacterium]|nr:hydroxyacid dehydrogenase [Armatimonadota bacterium]
MNRRTILMGMPWPAYDRTFAPADQERAKALYDLVVPDTRPTTEELLALADGRSLDAVVTVWGAPPLPVAFWEAHPECRFFGHMAGSVKHFFPGDTPQYLLDHGITVVCGQHGLGINVAECTVGLMIALSRRWGTLWHECRYEGIWGSDRTPYEPQTLLGATVGIVSASAIGRMVVEMIRPFGCRVLCYDPYLTDYEAGRLGVESVPLERLLAESDIISMHHPQTPETDRMIGARELGLIRDGAVFINTARPRAIDPEALLAEAQRGRLQIALDVTEPEPLPSEHPLRSCENVWIMPHRAGTGRHGSHRVGQIVMQGLDECFQGRAVAARYPIERLSLMA